MRAEKQRKFGLLETFDPAIRTIPRCRICHRLWHSLRDMVSVGIFLCTVCGPVMKGDMSWNMCVN